MGMIKIDKKTITIIALGVIVLSGAYWLLLGGDIRNDRNGVDDIRDDISRIEEQQRNTINRIESVENGLADSAERLGEISAGIGKTENNIDGIGDRIEQSTQRARNDAERIEEGQRIIEIIRNRGQTNTK